MSRILLVDDEAELLRNLRRLLAAEGYRVETAATAEEGLQRVEQRPPDLVLLDLRLPDGNGLELFGAIRRREPKLPVILMTAYGTTEDAIEATKQGAFDYVLKPFDVRELLAVVRQSLKAGGFRRARIEENGPPGRPARESLVGRSRAMQEVYKAIGRVAATDATVLIRGESGTGKELVARAIVAHSRRAERPFQVINCVAIPENLLESELFGYEKGAFTGAAQRRIGKIEQANGGTVFLDEIGDMPCGVQAKVLRLLQERSIERLGGRETIGVDVRILAATNRDLEAALREGRFREDLYYRLNVVTIPLPPLREHPEDIPILAEHFLRRFAAELGAVNPGITAAALEELRRRPWPGNVRELANVLQKALIFNRGTPVRAEDVLEALDAADPPAWGDPPGDEALLRRWARERLAEPAGKRRLEGLLARLEAVLVREALAMAGGNRSRAARLLGVSRPTLHARIEKYGLRLDVSVTEASAIPARADPVGWIVPGPGG